MKKFIVINLILILMVVNSNASDKHASVSEPEKIERTEKARKADAAFWDLIHGTNNYQNFSSVIKKLTEAQFEDPSDVFTTAHIGFSNIWAVSDGIQLAVAQAPNILDYLQNAERAFAKANAFAPDEARILGFLGYSRLSLGRATQNIDMQIEGQANVARSVALWPEWGHFGAGYGVDLMAPFDSPAFEQALTHYWDTLDVCANQAVDRTNPDFISYLELETLTGPDRACWDSWIAPYNLEGFFIVMGDALVKAGQRDTALIIYNNAKLMTQYDSWPFRELLDNRISNIDLNQTKFRQTLIPGQIVNPESSLIAATAISCAICHQGDADKYFEAPKWVGERANDYLVPY